MGHERAAMARGRRSESEANARRAKSSATRHALTAFAAFQDTAKEVRGALVLE
jgi:hypothetical protein